MLLKIAIRNLLRNKRRTIIIASSIIVGVIALIFNDGFMNGMLNQMLFNQVRINVSHIQIHKSGFQKDKTIKLLIDNPTVVESKLKKIKTIKAISKRIKAFGLVSSSSNSAGIIFNAINPAEEKKVSVISKSIKRGKFLSAKKHDILIGENLAEKLEVDLGEKIVLMTNRPDGKISSELFRVCGIFQTPSTNFDKSTVFINLSTAQNMLEIGNKISEFAIILNENISVEKVKSQIISMLNNDMFEVLSYNELLPFLVMQLDMYDQMMWIITFIIGLALAFGIVNTMLMAVYERVNEIGVLMSIGMKNSKIFSMILLEAAALGVISTIVGLLIGLILHFTFLSSGINLSSFASSLEAFGIGAIIYPDLSLSGTLSFLIFIPFVSVIGAIYPAYKAIKLKPVEAIRYV